MRSELRNFLEVDSVCVRACVFACVRARRCICVLLRLLDKLRHVDPGKTSVETELLQFFLSLETLQVQTSLQEILIWPCRFFFLCFASIMRIDFGES